EESNRSSPVVKQDRRETGYCGRGTSIADRHDQRCFQTLQRGVRERSRTRPRDEGWQARPRFAYPAINWRPFRLESICHRTTGLCWLSSRVMLRPLYQPTLFAV
ncbi:unnamed protein product, partial [Ectocarpus sp. 4 AP-2014]